jgi:hypothetical protein
MDADRLFWGNADIGALTDKHYLQLVDNGFIDIKLIDIITLF